MWRWQARYLEAGVDGLLRDKSRPPGTPPLSAAIKTLVLTKTMRETPPDATHWSVRSMARAVGISHTSVQNIWRAHGLKPHLVDSFKVSNDPAFAEKVEDVVGLYLDPPDKAVVFSVDAKSQIQALEPQPTGPAHEEGPGRHHDPRLQAPRHDHPVRGAQPARWQGHRPLHEAPPTRSSFVSSTGSTAKPCPIWTFTCHRQLRHPQDAGGQTVAEKTPALPHPFETPTASWLNMVERFFAEITRKRIRRGVFKSVADWSRPSTTISPSTITTPVPFVWTATATAILEKTARAKQTLETVRAGTKC